MMMGNNYILPIINFFSKGEIMNKLFYKLMDIEYLAKYLMACGIGANILIIVWLIPKIISMIASL